MKSGEYRLKFLADSTIGEPTEIYIPKVQFPEGYNIDIKGSKTSYETEDNVIKIQANESKETVIIIKRT